MTYTLNLGSLTVVLDQLTESSFPRTIGEPISTVEYSINGTPIEDGPAFENKHFWTINAICTPQDQIILEAMYRYSETLRRSLLPRDIFLWDAKQPFPEQVPRSRAIVPGTTEGVFGSGQFVAYFAIFKVLFVKMPEFEESGNDRIVHLILVETQKVVG